MEGAVLLVCTVRGGTGLKLTPEAGTPTFHLLPGPTRGPRPLASLHATPHHGRRLARCPPGLKHTCVPPPRPRAPAHRPDWGPPRREEKPPPTHIPWEDVPLPIRPPVSGGWHGRARGRESCRRSGQEGGCPRGAEEVPLACLGPQEVVSHPPSRAARGRPVRAQLSLTEQAWLPLCQRPRVLQTQTKTPAP